MMSVLRMDNSRAKRTTGPILQNLSRTIKPFEIWVIRFQLCTIFFQLNISHNEFYPRRNHEMKECPNGNAV